MTLVAWTSAKTVRDEKNQRAGRSGGRFDLSSLGFSELLRQRGVSDVVT